MLFPNYYEVLGVSPTAEDFLIRAAYKACAQKYHPDKYSGSLAEAQEKMRQINEAYEVLSNPESRRKYDIDLKASESSQRDTASSPADDAWKIALQYYPGLTDAVNRLSLFSLDLVESYKSQLLEDQRFSAYQSLARALEQKFLADRFGLHPMLIEFARELLLAGKRAAAKELSDTLIVMGNGVDPSVVIQTIEEKHWPSRVKERKEEQKRRDSSQAARSAKERQKVANEVAREAALAAERAEIDARVAEQSRLSNKVVLAVVMIGVIGYLAVTDLTAPAQKGSRTFTAPANKSSSEEIARLKLEKAAQERLARERKEEQDRLELAKQAKARALLNDQRVKLSQSDRARHDSTRLGIGNDFVKVSSDGALISNDALAWECVFDKANNLYWQAVGSFEKYKWVNNGLSNAYGSKIESGVIGRESIPTISQVYTEQFSVWQWESIANRKRLCGFSDWRVPSIFELKTLSTYYSEQSGKEAAKWVVGESDGDISYIDPNFFPDVLEKDSLVFWSSSSLPKGQSDEWAWGINFNKGYDWTSRRITGNYLRLVRSSPLQISDSSDK